MAFKKKMGSTKRASGYTVNRVPGSSNWTGMIPRHKGAAMAREKGKGKAASSPPMKRVVKAARSGSRSIAKRLSKRY